MIETIKENIVTRLTGIKRELIVNYKTWLVFILCSTILNDYHLGLGFICFFYSYLTSYLSHKLLHNDFCYMNIYNITHYYHHNNTDWLAIVTNCFVEFLIATNNIACKHIYDSFSFCNLFYINHWTILFMYLWYTTIHNINYGYLRVNQYHYLHHEQQQTNICPDFFDMIFNTKHESSPQVEDIDHYIPNIIFSFFIVYGIKCIYDALEPSGKEFSKMVLAILWFSTTISLTGFCSYILYSQIKDVIDNDLIKFLKPV